MKGLGFLALQLRQQRRKVFARGANGVVFPAVGHAQDFGIQEQKRAEALHPISKSQQFGMSVVIATRFETAHDTRRKADLHEFLAAACLTIQPTNRTAFALEEHGVLRGGRFPIFQALFGDAEIASR